MLIDGAAPLPEVNAGAVCAPLEHQFAIGVPLRQEVGQAFPIALLVNRDARVIAAGRTVAARDRPRVAAPPGREKIACRAVHRPLSIVHCCPNPLTNACLMTRRGRTHFGCSRPATAQPSLIAATENSPVATCLEPSSMPLLVVAGAGVEQFQLDAGFAIGVINREALRQLGSGPHSRPMAGPGSVLESVMRGLVPRIHDFPFALPFPAPPSRPAAARHARSPFQFHLSPVMGERAG